MSIKKHTKEIGHEIHKVTKSAGKAITKGVVKPATGVLATTAVIGAYATTMVANSLIWAYDALDK